MKNRIFFEESRTQIYQRIISAFSDALIGAGNDVEILPAGSRNPLELASRINERRPDFVFITNPHGFLSQHLKNRDIYFYELLKSHLVFIHHDNFFGPVYDTDEIKSRFEGFRRAADRSTHFCIEQSNVEDLRKLSVPNAWKIFHATEFTAGSAEPDQMYNCSFVGHVLKYSNQLERLRKRQPVHGHVADDLSARLQRLDYNIRSSAERHADRVVPDNTDITEWVTQKQYYYGLIHNTSLFFRGKLLLDLAARQSMDIFGGNPTYLHGTTGGNNIVHPNIRYHPPTTSPGDVRSIYAQSKISINITSLQFDTAIINRVMDIGGSRGFPLTDWRDDLSGLSVHDQISYRTVDELSDKIEYYLTHDSEREEIASQLHHEIMSGFTYEKAVRAILDRLR